MAKAEPALIRDGMSQTIIDTAERLALADGADTVTVRRVLQTLNITNRVFYNRFHNIGEVLDIVYRSTALKIRESIPEHLDPAGDFFQQVTDIVAATLVRSYETKMKFYQYVFASDSVSPDNYEWWKGQITRLIDSGKRRGVLRDVDTEIMSYAIWCFIRGYNADALGRKLPLETAVRNFRYSFGVLLDGMRAEPSPH